MRVNTESSLFSPEQIATIEEVKKAKYVCETCLRGKHGWINTPVAIFYQADPALIPDGGSQYFGLYFRSEGPLDSDSKPKLFITNAESAASSPMVGVVADDGEVIHSRYRHDYRKSTDGSVWVDGGRDYLRTIPNAKTVNLQIKEGELCIV